MRSQIRGLNKASDNAQDGISLIQVAEGALNETHSILQRMNELATQAANDTNTSVDRQSIKDEIEQLNEELDNKQKRIEELEADMESPGFWDNPDKSQNAMKELKGLKDAFERYNELETGLDDVKTLIEMAEESNDQSLIPEIPQDC